MTPSSVPTDDGPERSAVRLAKALISGQIGVVEASREFSSLRFKLGNEWDEDFLFFVAVDSETDHFPIGPARAHWNPTALTREDAAREKYEQLSRGDAIRHANNVATRYKDAV